MPVLSLYFPGFRCPAHPAPSLEGAYERFADLARAIGVADEKQGDIAAAEQFLKAIEHICEVCEVPTLEKYGIPREAFYAAIPKMAQDALDSGSPQTSDFLYIV